MQGKCKYEHTTMSDVFYKRGRQKVNVAFLLDTAVPFIIY